MMMMMINLWNSKGIIFLSTTPINIAYIQQTGISGLDGLL